MAFVFGLQTLWLIDFTRIFQLKHLKPKNKDPTNFYECCNLTKKVYLMYVRTRKNNERRRRVLCYDTSPTRYWSRRDLLSFYREAIIWFIDMLFDYWDSKSFLCWSRHSNSKAMYYGFIKWRMKKWPSFAWNNSLILLLYIHWNIRIIWIRISRASIR